MASGVLMDALQLLEERWFTSSLTLRDSSAVSSPAGQEKGLFSG